LHFSVKLKKLFKKFSAVLRLICKQTRCQPPGRKTRKLKSIVKSVFEKKKRLNNANSVELFMPQWVLLNTLSETRVLSV